jgi:3-oxoacyl-[acyl-carrier protein] reductase
VDLGLAGRVALVSGASSGLGLGIAKALAAEGAHVALAARDARKLEAARAEVDARGPGTVTATALDIRDAEAVQGWVGEIASGLGELHVVVANAGGPPAGPATAFGVSDYREAVELSLLAPIALVQAALPHVRAAGWGRIIFVTSESVKQPIPTLALSNTARAGVAGYAKSLVADLGAGDITVNVLAPGWHRTARVVDVLGDDADAKAAAITADIPLGRMGDPDDFGAVATFLASRQASYITGVVLAVDGGHVRSLL